MQHLLFTVMSDFLKRHLSRMSLFKGDITVGILCAYRENHGRTYTVKDTRCVLDLPN